MADPTAPAPAVVTPSPAATAPIPAVAATAASATPVESTPPPAVPLTTPQAPPAVPEPPLTQPAPVQPTSLLSEPVKPAEPAKESTPAAVEPAKPSAEPAPLPAFEAFKLPEGITLDQGEMGKFAERLGQFELDTKADHAKLQAFGQTLIDSYIADMQRVQEAQQAHWTRMRDEWRGNFINDPDLGKTNQSATLTRCAQMIEQYGGTQEQVAELRNILAVTGAGDHPAVIRLISNIGKVLSEPTKTAVGKQLAPQTQSRSARRYANTLNGAGAN